MSAVPPPSTVQHVPVQPLTSSLLSYPRFVQNWSKLEKKGKIPKDYEKKGTIPKKYPNVVEAIIKVANDAIQLAATKGKKKTDKGKKKTKPVRVYEELTELPDAGKKYKVQGYARITSGKTRLQQQVKLEEVLTNAHLVFFYWPQKKPGGWEGRRPIFTLTTNQAWRVVRDYIDYRMPFRIAGMTLNPDCIRQVERRCLVGAKSADASRGVDQTALVKTSNIYFLVSKVVGFIKEGSPLRGLFIEDVQKQLREADAKKKEDPESKYDASKEEKKLKQNLKEVKHRAFSLEVSAASVKPSCSLSLGVYPNLFELICNYLSGKKVLDSEKKPVGFDVRLEFLRYLQPVPHLFRELDKSLVKSVLEMHNHDANAPIFLRHKHLDDLLRAQAVEFKKVDPSKERDGGHFYACHGREKKDDPIPSVAEIVTHFFPQEAPSDVKTLLECFRNVLVRITDSSGKDKLPVSLLSCLEGEVTYREKTFFKISGMWYQMEANYNALLHEDFRNFMRRTLLNEDDPAALPLEWHGGSAFPLSDAFLASELGTEEESEEFQEVLELLHNQKKQCSYVAKRQVVEYRLGGKILETDLIARNKAKIEEMLQDGLILDAKARRATFKGYPKANKKAAHDYIWDALNKGRNIAYQKDGWRIANPLVEHLQDVEDDVREELRTILQAFSTQEEGAYNLAYLGKDDWLVFDKVTPNNIEFCDLLFSGEEGKLYLYHVKEKFGGATRDAASQIINGARQIRSAISCMQEGDYISQLWKKLDQHASPPLKNQLADFEGGYPAFRRLFYEREIVYVYAFLEEPTKSWHDDIEKPVYINHKHLDFFNSQQIFDDLKSCGYLNEEGVMHPKLRKMTRQDDFQLTGYSKWKKNRIFAHIKSLRKEASKKVEIVLAAADFDTVYQDADPAQIYQSLVASKYLDSVGRLTGKFFATTKEDDFELKDYHSNFRKVIYQHLCAMKSQSDSTLARLDLLHLEDELKSMRITLKIAEVKRPELQKKAAKLKQKLKIANASTQADSIAESQMTMPVPFEFEESEESNHNGTNTSVQSSGSESSKSSDSASASDGSVSSSTSEKITQGPKPLANIGNSCYINASLQLMRLMFEPINKSGDLSEHSAEEVFSEQSEKSDSEEITLSEKPPKSPPILRAGASVSKCIANLKDSPPWLERLSAFLANATEPTESNLKAFRRLIFESFDDSVLALDPSQEENRVVQQHDAHTFFNELLEKIGWHIHCYDVNTMGGVTSQPNLNEAQGILSLAFPRDEEGEIKKKVTLQEAITHAFTPEEGDEGEYAVHFRMTEPDEYVLLHIKRFDNQNTKINQRLRLPDNLLVDIPIHPLNEDIANNQPYQVIGVLNHCHGNTASSGHYQARVCHDDQWYRCDDDSVRAFSMRDKFKRNLELGYIFLLKRV